MQFPSNLIARLTAVQEEIKNAPYMGVTGQAYAQLVRRRYDLIQELSQNEYVQVGRPENYFIASQVMEPEAMGQLADEKHASVEALQAALLAGEDAHPSE